MASAAFVAIFVALTLSAFHEPTPHGLPVGIVASAAVTRHVEHALGSAAPGAFSFRSYDSAASATTGIAQRQVDGEVGSHREGAGAQRDRRPAERWTVSMTAPTPAVRGRPCATRPRNPGSTDA